jgi:hypothetical protein
VKENKRSVPGVERQGRTEERTHQERGKLGKEVLDTGDTVKAGEGEAGRVEERATEERPDGVGAGGGRGWEEEGLVRMSAKRARGPKEGERTDLAEDGVELVGDARDDAVELGDLRVAAEEAAEKTTTVAAEEAAEEALLLNSGGGGGNDRRGGKGKGGGDGEELHRVGGGDGLRGEGSEVMRKGERDGEKRTILCSGGLRLLCCPSRLQTLPLG